MYCFWPLEISTIITIPFYMFNHFFRIITWSLLGFTNPVLNTVPKSNFFSHPSEIYPTFLHHWTHTHISREHLYHCYVRVNVIVFFIMTHKSKYSSGEYRHCLSEQARLVKYPPLLGTFPHRKQLKYWKPHYLQHAANPNNYPGR